MLSMLYRYVWLVCFWIVDIVECLVVLVWLYRLVINYIKFSYCV